MTALSTQIANIRTVKTDVVDAAKALAAAVQHDLDHGVYDMAALLTAYTDLQVAVESASSLDAFEYPTVEIDEVEYHILLPLVNFNGVEYTAEEIADDEDLAADMLAEGVAFLALAPVAEFSATPLSGETHTEVEFTDESENATSWNWDFGTDGGGSTLQNPTYEYVFAGTFTVTLTVRNAYGEATETKVAYITITEPE